jgi:drug/metabolite transporter (DMT)-like permease
MKQITSQADPRAIIALVAMGAAFGASFLFMKVLSDEIATFEIVAGRLILGATVLAVFIILRNKPLNADPRNIAKISGLAVIESIIPFSLVAWAETRIDSSTASLLISTMPVFTVIVAMFLLPDERRAPVRLMALPLGIAGVVVLTGGDVLRLSGGDAIGQLAVIGAAACYGLSAVFTKFLLRSNDPINLTGTKLGVAAAMATVLTLTTNGLPQTANLSAEGWLSLAGIGLISTAGAFTIYIWLVGRAGSIFASMVTYVSPVFGVFFGWTLLGESIGPWTGAGAGLIASAIAAVMFGPRFVETAAEWLQRRRPVTLPAPVSYIVPVPATAQAVCQEN